MTKTNKISLLLSLILLSNAAFATPYLSGQVGYMGAGNNNPFSNIFDGNTYSATYTSRVAAGYLWDVNPCLKVGLETGVMTSMVDLLGVVDFYATQKVDVFAKAGTQYIRHAYDHFSPKAAVGIGYDVLENVNVNLSLDHTFLSHHQGDISALMAGVKFNFG